MATQRPSSSTNSEDTRKRKRDNSCCSEEDKKIISSSSPSSSTPRLTHDVFLSFRGKDTRKSFTAHLYEGLNRIGIQVFRDDKSLKKGKCISKELLQAIQESQYAIVIFSANYASSKWCLRELAEIVEWKETKNLTIIPIFYHVDPSDVSNQRGTFAEAFAAHEKDPKVDIKEIETWRNACRKVGKIAGEHINGERYETEIIQEISGNIFLELNSRSSLHDNKKFVGIHSRVKEMMNLLHMESNDVRFVGIHGMGGVGKTTLAQIIYDRVYSNCQFEGRTIISFNGEKSTARDLAFLQTQLLSGIMQERIEVSDPHKGIEMIRSRMRNKKVFIVLDNVDNDEQLKALAGDHNWFGPGSRVIMTCRDSHLLKRNKVNDMCAVQPLQPADALELFSLSAFNETHPPEDYKDLYMDFVNYAGGLPLALEVLGRYLFGRTIDFWKGARDNLKANPKTKIFDILKISFDGLEVLQQQLFLDVACFSDERIYVNFKKIYSADVIEVLIDKSLVSTSKDGRYFKRRLPMHDLLKEIRRQIQKGRLTMHDLLKEMGRQIVHRECPQEPGQRSRLFHHEDVFHVLKNNTGTNAIEGIVMDLMFGIPGANHSEIINAEAFSKMKNLRLLHFFDFGYIKWSENPLEHMPSDKLQFLRWFKCPSKSWPTRFQPKNLIVLEMPDSCIEQLWTESMVLPNLKELNLGNCENLIEMPNLTNAPKLEKINFSRCKKLSEVHPSIKVLKQLQELRMSCTRIKQLRTELMVLPNLKELDLSYCENLTETPNLSGAPNLEIIDFSNCKSLCKVPPSIKKLKQLQKLEMHGTQIKKPWKRSVVLPNLKELHLSSCLNLIEMPILSGAPNLEIINFSNCKRLCKVHSSITVLKRLQELRMPHTQIKQLWEELVVLPNLKELDVSYCENLTETPNLSGAPNLEIIDFSSCRSLCKVHRSIKKLKRLQELRMSYTSIKQLWKGSGVLPNLKELHLSSCLNLIKIPDLSGAPNLEKIDFSYCRSLGEFHSSITVLKRLQELRMPNTQIKQLWEELVVFDNLKELDLSSCVNLIEMPVLSGAPNLEIINFSNCRSLCKVHPSIRKLKRLQKLKMSNTRIKQLWKESVVLPNLKELDLSHCENLTETLNLSGAPNLEIIDFSSCKSLCKVPPSIKKLKRLQKLKMYGTQIKKLWKGLVVFDNLKELDLSSCQNLIETPNLSGSPNLEIINCSWCKSLCKVHPSILDLKRLKFLSLNESLPRLLILDKSCSPSLFMSFSGLRKLCLTDCNNISIFPSVICSLSSLESLRLVFWSRLEKFPDLNRLECLEEFEARGTAITQMPPVNLIPKNIRSLRIEGRKRMPRKSRDHLEMDTGSPVEYEMEEMLEVESLQIYLSSLFRKQIPFGSSVREQISSLSSLSIRGWSLGSRIPEWVHNKSTGSSLQIELDGNTMSVIGCAIFIVCDCHQFHSPEATSIPRLFKETSSVRFIFRCERDDGSLENFFQEFSLSLVKPSVCWAYARTPRLFNCLKSSSSDNQSFIKISRTRISSPTSLKVKEWGIHLVCADDTGLGLGSDLDSYRQFYSAWKCGMTRNED